MVKAEKELLNYERGAFAIAMSARAEADARAEFDMRRGIRLEAKAEAATDLHSKLAAAPDGGAPAALLKGQLALSARGAFAAQLDVHGLFSEFMLGAEARARIQGDIRMTGQGLLDALGVASQGPLEELPPSLNGPIHALLDQMEIGAGVFAEVYLALKAHARLVAMGSIIPSDRNDGKAGFTVQFNYGYAYIWGAGVTGHVDVDFPDPFAAVEAVISSASTELLRLLPEDCPPVVRTLLRLLLPLAGAAAVAVGRDLGAPRSQRDDAAETSDFGAIVGSFLAQLREQALALSLRTVLDAGIDRGLDEIDRALADLIDEGVRETAEAVLERVEPLIEQFRDVSSLPDGLGLLVDLAAELADLADGTFGDPLAGFVDGVAMAAAAAALIRSLLGEDDAASLPAPLTARVNFKLRPDEPDTTPVNLTDIIGYLGAMSGLLSGAALETIDRVSTLVGATPDALVALLWELGSDTSSPDAAQNFAQDVLEQMVDMLDQELTPVLDQLPPGDLTDLTQFVRPLLEIIEFALPPLIAAGGNLSEDDAARLRDELDVLLIQLFGPLVVRVLDRIIRPYFRRGVDQLRELADRIENDAQRTSPEFADFFAMANALEVVVRINETIVAGALRETADILAVVETSGFDSALKLMNSFILLPEPSEERRAQLAKLAGSDESRVGDDDLKVMLAEAMFRDSHLLALGMIPPSVRMTTMIAAEQGLLPMATLAQDARDLGIAVVANVTALVNTGNDIVGILRGLWETGRVRAEQLLQLGVSLKNLIRSLADIVDAVINLIKDLTWPIILASTLGVAALAKEVFDDFFAGAHWLVDEITDKLERLADVLVESAIAVARDWGILDTGSGEDLGQLGQAVRQRALGDPSQPGIVLFGGAVSVTHAQLATMVANEALANGQVRDTVRDMHVKARQQAEDAKRSDQLALEKQHADQAAGKLQNQLAALQRDTGAPMEIAIIPADGILASGAILEVEIFGADLEFVSNSRPLVHVEIGGWPVPIDPTAWLVDEQGALRGRFKVVADATRTSPAPFVTNRAATVSSALNHELGELIGGAELVAVGAETAAVRQAERRLLVDDVGQMTADGAQPGWWVAAPVSAMTANTFIPAALHDEAAIPRRAAVLAVNREALETDLGTRSVAFHISALPGVPAEGFIDTNVFGDLFRPVLESPASSSVAVATRARPGFLVVTAHVRAVPKVDQDSETTPHASVTTSYVLQPADASFAGESVQDNWRWCTKCFGLFFGDWWQTSVCPAGGTHSDPINSGNYSLLHNAAPAADKQANWRWCTKCQGLYMADRWTKTVCPAGGSHSDPAHSGNYSLFHGVAPAADKQANWRWCTKCEGLYMGDWWQTSVCPAGSSHSDPINSGNYSLLHLGASSTVLATAGESVQDNWRWCTKCFGLFFGDWWQTSVCPAGGTHSDPINSGNYSLLHNAAPAADKQANWRWCTKCQGLYMADRWTKTVCPAGGSHSDPAHSGNYSLFHGVAPAADKQANWRWCTKCEGLYMGDWWQTSVCPAGSSHSDPINSGNYSLLHE